MSSQISEGVLHTERPPQILVAVIILLISVVVGCTYALYMLAAPYKPLLPAGIAFAAVVVAYAILKRQRWARLLLLVVTLLGGVALAASLINTPLSHESATTYAIRGMQSVLRFTAVYILFTGPARRWFRDALT